MKPQHFASAKKENGTILVILGAGCSLSHGYSATFLFHMIPAFVETSTRLPVGAPLVTDRDGREVQMATGILFLLFLVGAGVQIRRLCKEAPKRAAVESAVVSDFAATPKKS